MDFISKILFDLEIFFKIHSKDSLLIISYEYVFVFP